MANTDIKNLEEDYLAFIRHEKYGTPIAMTKPGQSEDDQTLEDYFHGQAKFQAYCVPCGCACPVTICCWIIGFPLALYSCITKLQAAKDEAESSARSVRNTRTVLFPTMIVMLSKNRETGQVFEMKTLKFLDHQHLTQEVNENIDEANQDGINGCVQVLFVPDVSCVNIFTGKTRKIFLGGDRGDTSNYEDKEVPEMQMIAPLEDALRFSEALQEAFRNIKSGDYDRCMDYVQTQQPKLVAKIANNE